MKEIVINNVTIPLFDESVGMLLSGGVDSSLLLYILLSNKKETLEIFTIASNLKGRNTAKVTANVIEKCIQLTGNSNVNHHISYVDVQTVDNLNSAMYTMISEKKIDKFYAAVTANPPKYIADSFIDAEWNSEHEYRDPLIQRPIINGRACHPFTNIDKVKIKGMYESLGLLNSLFPLTMSCELEYPPTDVLKHCQNCWWCKERFWGFGKFI